MAKRLEPGFTGRDVKTLQRQLIRENDSALQMYGVDGSYGPETEKAVLTFQQKHSDIDNSGIADLTTQARLISVINYDLGSTGRGVKMLQEALMRFTIALPSGADGSYGPETKQGVQTFQQHNAILDNGIAGAVTFDTLDKALNTYYLEPGSSGTIYGSVTRMLQSQLNQNGFDLEIDGSYGPKTVQAVKDFQQDHSLHVDGIAGPRTLNLLDLKADHPMTNAQIEQAAEEEGFTEQSLMSDEKSKYLNDLESNSVFTQYVQEEQKSINALGASKMTRQDTSIIVLTGVLNSNENKMVMASFSASSEQLERLSIIEQAGSNYTDLITIKSYDVEGNELENYDVTSYDLEDKTLQYQMELKTAWKDSQVASLALDLTACDYLTALAAGAVNEFIIVRTAALLAGGAAPFLITASGAFLLGAILNEMYC